MSGNWRTISTTWYFADSKGGHFRASSILDCHALINKIKAELGDETSIEIHAMINSESDEDERTCREAA